LNRVRQKIKMADLRTGSTSIFMDISMSRESKKWCKNIKMRSDGWDLM